MQDSYWRALGYSANPLFADPLETNETEQSLFVGRDGELRNFLLAMSRRRGGIISIGGHPGSGKTSLVNRVQWLIETGQAGRYAEEARLGLVLPCLRPVQIDADDSRLTIIKKCRDSLRHALFSWCKANKRPPTELAQLTTPSNAEEDIAAEIEGYAGHLAELGLSGAIVAIDNTELLDDDFLVATLDTLRDQLLRISGLWWVVIGREGLSGMIELRNARLRGYTLSIGGDIDGLTVDEFEAIIGQRHMTLRSNADVTFPVPPDIYRLVYSTSRGDLRFSLGFLDSALASYISKLGRAPDFDVTQWLAIAQSRVRELLQSMRVDNPIVFSFVDRMLDVGVDTVCINDHKKFQVEQPEEMKAMLEALCGMQLLWKERGAKYEFNYHPRGILEMERKFRQMLRATKIR